jgi:hypothetical protein
MTEKFKTKMVMKEERYDYECFCDLCKQKIEPIDSYRRNNFELRWDIGTSYPECGIGITKKVDLCVECREKLFAWLKSQGCKIQETEWEY